jgi:hypothetical protein
MAQTPKNDQTLDLGDRESIYQPTQKGLIFPERPTGMSIAQERHHRIPICTGPTRWRSIFRRSKSQTIWTQLLQTQPDRFD